MHPTLDWRTGVARAREERRAAAPVGDVVGEEHALDARGVEEEVRRGEGVEVLPINLCGIISADRKF